MQNVKIKPFRRRLACSRICNLYQHVGVAREIERAETGEVLAAQPAASAAITPVSECRSAKKGILQNVPGDFREKANAGGAGGHIGD